MVNFKAARFVPDQELPKVIAILNKVTYSVASPPDYPALESIFARLFRLKAADALGQVLDAEAMALPAPSRTQFDHRTKGKKPATILLPNPVAAHDRGRDVMDGRAKKFRYTHREQARVFGAVAGLECWRGKSTGGPSHRP